jgi:hypothetical protein
MTKIEQKITEFETRPATFQGEEQQQREARLSHLSSINRFEGLTPSLIDKRLFSLLAAGKVSKQEYLDLCLSDAHNA